MVRLDNEEGQETRFSQKARGVLCDGRRKMEVRGNVAAAIKQCHVLFLAGERLDDGCAGGRRRIR